MGAGEFYYFAGLKIVATLNHSASPLQRATEIKKFLVF
jgi:hypothetical protein